MKIRATHIGAYTSSKVHILDFNTWNGNTYAIVSNFKGTIYRVPIEELRIEDILYHAW